jgi:putative oxidoreductase
MRRRSLAGISHPKTGAPHNMTTFNNSPASRLSLNSFGCDTNDIWLLLGRIALGSIFIVSGFGKLTHLGGFEASLAMKGVPLPWLAALVGAPVEFFGGLAIVLGIAGRYAALLMFAFTVVATLISHRYWQYSEAAVRQAQLSNFLKNIAIMGGFLVLFSQGVGRFALDRFLHLRNPRREAR